MKTQFRYLLLISSFLLLLASCKKPVSDDTPYYYVKYKRNDTLVTSTKSIHVWLQPNNTSPGMMDFLFVSNTDDFKHFLGIAIQKNGNVETGTYQFGNSGYSITTDYFKDVGLATEQIFSVENAAGHPPCSFTIELTSITAKEFRGNFTGNYMVDFFTGQTITITDGEFVIRRNP